MCAQVITTAVNSTAKDTVLQILIGYPSDGGILGKGGTNNSNYWDNQYINYDADGKYTYANKEIEVVYRLSWKGYSGCFGKWNRLLCTPAQIYNTFPVEALPPDVAKMQDFITPIKNDDGTYKQGYNKPQGLIDLCMKSYGMWNNDSKPKSWTSLKELPANTIIAFNSNEAFHTREGDTDDTPTRCSNGIFLSYSATSGRLQTNNIAMQQALIYEGPYPSMYFRLGYGNYSYDPKDGITKDWFHWQKYVTTKSLADDITAIQSQLNFTNHIPLYAAFRSIGVIGDSLASGECYYGSKGRDMYEYSWLAHMCRPYQINWYCFSQGGQTAHGWIHDTNANGRGYGMASQSKYKCQAYIIALEQNDSNHPESYPIGSTSDINDSDYTKNADTFYGNYARIICAMKAIEPNAKFFLVTDPLGSQQDVRKPYAEAIRYCAKKYSNCYLIDNEKNNPSEFLDNSTFIGNNRISSHYNSTGYLAIGERMGRDIDAIMRNNPNEFKYIQFIGTDMLD